MSERRVENTKPREHYLSVRYVDEQRLVSLAHQIRQCHQEEFHSVLEVGRGNGVLEFVLKSAGKEVTSVDLDPRTLPDIVADVTGLPFADASFDAVCAYQVLEHLPFERLSRALSEMQRVARRRVFLSLPDSRRWIRLLLDLPVWRGYQQRLISVGKAKANPPSLNEHYWEIGRSGIDLDAVLTKSVGVGLRVERHYRAFANPYHHFFEFRVSGERE